MFIIFYECDILIHIPLLKNIKDQPVELRKKAVMTVLELPVGPGVESAIGPILEKTKNIEPRIRHVPFSRSGGIILAYLSA